MILAIIDDIFGREESRQNLSLICRSGTCGKSDETYGHACGMTKQFTTVGFSTDEKIKRDIIFGACAPGSKLKLDGLKKRYWFDFDIWLPFLHAPDQMSKSLEPLATINF